MAQPRPQFTMEQRNFLALEYHKHKGTRNFKDQLLADFQAKFPGVRVPGKNIMAKILKKQMEKGTVNNCNSKTSPGDSHSGRIRTHKTPANTVLVKGVMDRDGPKQLGDPTVSPVSSARRNVLGLDKSTWWRIKLDLRYHPYKVVRRQLLKPADLPRREAFCIWILTLTDQQLLQFLFSDEAVFQQSGHVNSKNVVRYAPLKTSDHVNGGRPAHLTNDRPTYSPKIMVFCGVRQVGTFGLKCYRNETMTGATDTTLCSSTMSCLS